MKKLNVLMITILSLVSLSLLAGCANATGASPRGDMSLPGTVWVLRDLDGETLNLERDITLRFEEDRLSGNASCNSYSSEYTLKEGKLELGPVVSTLMACPTMEYETSYLQALAETHSIRFEGEELQLLDEKGDVLLVFIPMPHASLEGTTWTLTGWNDGLGFTSLVLETEITLELTEGEASGSAGCNHYFGAYAVDDEKLTFDALANTEMYCMEPEGIMEQETGYLQNLGLVDSFRIEGTTLEMFDVEGMRLMSFVTAE